MAEQAGPDSSDRPLSGLGRFAAKIAVGTAIAVAMTVLALRWMAPGGTGAEDQVTPGELADRSGASTRRRADAANSVQAAVAPSSRVTSAVADLVERRHARGELSDAQRRFEPCPGGDVRREAWIDREGRVLKLLHDRADGTRVEEWFDDSGRLREALSTGRGGAWSRRLSVVDGAERVEELPPGALAPDVPPAPLVRRDPSRAFFSGAGCGEAPGR